jgi:hypothetical protein
MKYLSLSEEEIKNLKILTGKRFIFYLSTALGLLLISFCLLGLLKPVQIQRGFDSLSLSELIFTFCLILIGITIVIFLWLYRSMLLQSKKKVYTGAVSEKRIKENEGQQKFYIYMDGNKFRVSETEYNSFEIGAPIEFHVSVKDKHLLKVSKPLEPIAITG